MLAWGEKTGLMESNLHEGRFVVPAVITMEHLEEWKRGMRVYVPKGTKYEDWYPAFVVSYASGRRQDDCEGSGPGVVYAKGLTEYLHKRGLQCFSGLQVPAGVDWETFMLRLTGENGKRDKPKVLIIILTAALYQSKACLKEIDTAIRHEVDLLPVRFEDKLPGKAEQWTNLKGQEWEMRKLRVQEKLNALNNIPNPGTVLTRACALDDVMAEIEKYLLPTSDAPIEASPSKHTAQPPTPKPMGGPSDGTRFPVGYKIHVEDVEHVSQLRQLSPGRIGKLPKNLSLHDKLILEAPSHAVRVDGVAPAAIAAMSCDEAATWTGLQLLHMTREQLMAITEQQLDSLCSSTVEYVKDNFEYINGKIFGSQIAISKRFQIRIHHRCSPAARDYIGDGDKDNFPPTIGETPDEFVARAKVALRVPLPVIEQYTTPEFHDQFTFEYGELVLVRRSSGALNYAQVVSNASGLHVLEWSVEDVANWAKSCSVMAAVKEIDGTTLMRVTQRRLREGETQVIKDLQELGVPAIHGMNLLDSAMALRLPTCLFNHRPSTQAGPLTKRAQPMEIEGVTIEQMKAAGFSPSSCKWAGFTLKELVSAQHLSPDVCSALEARDAGATKEQMKAAGFLPSERGTRTCSRICSTLCGIGLAGFSRPSERGTRACSRICSALCGLGLAGQPNL